MDNAFATQTITSNKLGKVDPFTAGGRRILEIDCRQYASGGDGLPSEHLEENIDSGEETFSQQEKMKHMTRMFRKIGDDDKLGGSHPAPAPDTPEGILIDQLKMIAAADNELPPSEKTDAVNIIAPDAYNWSALDGLSPKHLTVIAHNDPGIQINYLDNLKHPWLQLETLSIEGISLINERDWASTISNVKAIAIEYCDIMNFVAPEPGRFANLTRLKVIESNALHLFVSASENIPGFANRLEILHLQSTRNRTPRKEELAMFREKLLACNSLRDLRLTLSHGKDASLFNYIPSSVKSFSFHCSCSLTMLEDLKFWLQKVKDKKWLPNIKNFEFCSDAKSFEKPATATKNIETTTLQLNDVEMGNQLNDVEMGAEDSIVEHSSEVTSKSKTWLEEDFGDEEEDEDYSFKEEVEDDSDEDDDMDDDDDDIGFELPSQRHDHNEELRPDINLLISTVVLGLKERNL